VLLLQLLLLLFFFSSTQRTGSPQRLPFFLRDFGSYNSTAMASQEEDNFVQAIPSTTPATAVIHISRDGCCLGRLQPPGAPWGGLPVYSTPPANQHRWRWGVFGLYSAQQLFLLFTLLMGARGKRRTKCNSTRVHKKAKEGGVRWGRRWSSLFGCMAPLSHTQGRPLPSRNTHELTLRQPVS
jgi:hypothetical protein